VFKFPFEVFSSHPPISSSDGSLL